MVRFREKLIFRCSAWFIFNLKGTKKSKARIKIQTSIFLIPLIVMHVGKFTYILLTPLIVMHVVNPFTDLKIKP